MNHKWKKKLFSHLEEEELTFTEKDRVETLHKIQDKNSKKKPMLPGKSRQYAVPVLGAVMMIMLVILFLMPDLHFNNELAQDSPDEQQAAQQDTSSFSVFLMGRDAADETNRRNSLNILLTYNSDKNSINVVSIPRDAYVDIFNAQGEVIGQDKLIHASAYEKSPEPAIAAVSGLLDVPVDYYAALPEESIYEKLEIAKEDVQNNRQIWSDMGKLLEDQLSASDIKTLLEESSATNMTGNTLSLMEDLHATSIKVIDMAKGAEPKVINGIYYAEIDQKLVEETSHTLNKHLEKE